MFQYRQGFYFIYIIITLFYVILLSRLPQNILNISVPLIVFSDPSMLGLFFIGGIIMLEKTQGIINCIIVTPLRVHEYILSKLISLTIIAVLAGFFITAITYGFSVNWLLLTLVITLTSVFFTLTGFLISANCSTLNQYFIKMIPWMLILIIPCFSILEFKYSYLFTVIPSVSLLKLLIGAFNGINLYLALILIIYMCVINYYFLLRVKKVFEEKILYGGQ
ncbi:fluoroquinolone export ABC transporter permease subunit [Oceanirhabdus sp. W0125-5]|uniref:fluoroquinolone export ABC transporter permease subunit n=1 Tax=Oceanirhabdus sp. W0125-5 TaxID=2999116 RepID=UPI003FA60DA0